MVPDELLEPPQLIRNIGARTNKSANFILLNLFNTNMIEEVGKFFYLLRKVGREFYLIIREIIITTANEFFLAQFLKGG